MREKERGLFFFLHRVISDVVEDFPAILSLCELVILNLLYVNLFGDQNLERWVVKIID